MSESVRDGGVRRTLTRELILLKTIKRRKWLRTKKDKKPRLISDSNWKTAGGGGARPRDADGELTSRGRCLGRVLEMPSSPSRLRHAVKTNKSARVCLLCDVNWANVRL